MRRGSIVAIVVIGVIAGGVATAVALVRPGSPWTPRRGRPHRLHVLVRDRDLHRDLRARRRGDALHGRPLQGAPDDEEDGPPIHGHTGLEITWTAIPFVLVTAIAIVSAIVLSRNDAQAKDTLQIDVDAQQFEWTFSYPDAGNATSPVLRLPEGRSLELYMRALDVIHAFFVPEFRRTRTSSRGWSRTAHHARPASAPTRSSATELCGLGHSHVRSQAIVMKPEGVRRMVEAPEHEHEGVNRL